MSHVDFEDEVGSIQCLIVLGAQVVPQPSLKPISRSPGCVAFVPITVITITEIAGWTCVTLSD